MAIFIEHKSSKSKYLIIFVHGLGGNDKSFLNNDEKLFHEYFDESILNICDIGYFTYTSKLVSSKFQSLISNIYSKINKEINHDIGEIAELLKTDYNNYIDSYDAIHFIGHSMGGLIIKDILINKNLSHEKRPFYITLATPHFGSKMADKLIILKDKHEQIKTLKTNSDTLVQLNARFIDKKDDFKRKYYYAQDDQIVLKDSACSEGDELERVAVSGNHISICKPNNQKESETLLLDINKTIKGFLGIRDIVPVSTSNTASLNSLVLFDSFSIDKKPYYLERRIDRNIKKILELKHIWLYGESGVGKTNLAQYYFLTNNRTFYHATYFTTSEKDVEKYLQLIYEELIDKIDSDIEISNGVNISTKLSNVLCYLSRNYPEVTIHLDELDDLGNERFQDFFIAFVDILTNIRDGCNLNNVNFIISTIFNPCDYVKKLSSNSHKEKIETQFQFISIEQWTHEELYALYDIISSALDISVENIQDKISTFNGKPRALKEMIKTEIVIGRAGNEESI